MTQLLFLVIVNAPYDLFFTSHPQNRSTPLLKFYDNADFLWDTQVGQATAMALFAFDDFLDGAHQMLSYRSMMLQ